MKEVLVGIAEVLQEPRVRVLGAGVAMVGGENLKRAYGAHGVVGVKVY